MKKVCILSITNIKHMTLVSLYTEKLSEHKIPYDIIYMDKYGIDEPNEANKIFKYTNVIENKKYVKIKKMFQIPRFQSSFRVMRFLSFAKKVIKNEKYDFIIVWNEITAFIFAEYLYKNYKNRYCLNIRDYFIPNTVEKLKKFEKVIIASAFTTISSDGFTKFLPKHEYIHIHSLNMKILSNVQTRNSFIEESKPIKLTFIGNVRFYDQNKLLMEIFKNNLKFELHYYGVNAEILEKYANENGITNTAFHGSFNPDDTYLYIKNIDIVNNLYGSNDLSLDYALSIKLYYGVYNYIPILVNSNTHMATIIDKYGIGYVVDEINDQLPHKLFEWYANLNFAEFKKNCDLFINEINKQNETFHNIFMKIFLSDDLKFKVGK